MACCSAAPALSGPPLIIISSNDGAGADGVWQSFKKGAASTCCARAGSLDHSAGQGLSELRILGYGLSSGKRSKPRRNPRRCRGVGDRDLV